jgi:formamidopyrimidine-DNA glycosylase
MEDGTYIWNNLGVTGKWSFEPSKHARLQFDFQGLHAFFNDLRGVGSFRFNVTYYETQEELDRLGIDFLIDSPSYKATKHLLGLTRNRKKCLAEVIIDQRNYAGLGNCLSSEVLYLAGLSPHRKVSTLKDCDVQILHEAIQDTLRATYKLETEGRQPDYHVYNREKSHSGHAVKREVMPNKHVFYWVPEVQK